MAENNSLSSYTSSLFCRLFVTSCFGRLLVCPVGLNNVRKISENDRSLSPSGWSKLYFCYKTVCTAFRSRRLRSTQYLRWATLHGHIKVKWIISLIACDKLVDFFFHNSVLAQIFCITNWIHAGLHTVSVQLLSVTFLTLGSITDLM